ncbi:hypothetical protein [Thiomicrorhabdus sediminis]|uniref:Uncharacterized protein n=1 Tax=Thiomicrorhabdus sediminis TaxID=2580412 RepID=A0A4P9K7Y3_9GAMM|nr:hypothetical protein [Thiomicrorhabdus sediminis]QCU90357.1 hypothetical protein FE785_06790 [Thiomicrorhabdus sediminis]
MLVKRSINHSTLNSNRYFFAALLSLLLTFAPSSVYAEKANPSAQISADQRLHSDLVLSALQLDFYNARCRGLSIARNFNRVNRLFVTKYSLTANNYIKDFIAEDVREEKMRQEILFKRNLSKMGGCDKAKDAGWIKEIHDHFKALYRKAETSSWFPETL